MCRLPGEDGHGSGPESSSLWLCRFLEDLREGPTCLHPCSRRLVPCWALISHLCPEQVRTICQRAPRRVPEWRLLAVHLDASQGQVSLTRDSAGTTPPEGEAPDSPSDSVPTVTQLMLCQSLRAEGEGPVNHTPPSCRPHVAWRTRRREGLAQFPFLSATNGRI